LTGKSAKKKKHKKKGPKRGMTRGCQTMRNAHGKLNPVLLPRGKKNGEDAGDTKTGRKK